MWNRVKVILICRQKDCFLIDRLVEATDVNAENNKLKAAYLHKGSRAIIILLIFISMATVPYLFKIIVATD